MKRLADDAQELIETIYTDAEYRAMIEEQHWGLMRKRYQSKPAPLPTDDEPTEEIRLPSDMVFRCAIGVVAGFVFLCAIWLGAK